MMVDSTSSINDIVKHILLNNLRTYDGNPSSAEIIIDMSDNDSPYYFLMENDNTTPILNEIIRKIYEYFKKSYNPITNIKKYKNTPREISQFKSLKSLIILGLYKYVEEISNIITLERLEMSGLDYMSESIGRLVNLKHLFLTDIPNLSTLPNSMSNMQELKSINISYSDLNKIPNFIFQLRKLQSIAITNSKIDKLPIILDFLSLPDLKELYLNDNLIEEFPKKELYELFNFDDKIINLDNNPFNDPCYEKYIHKLEVNPVDETSTKSTIVLSITAHGHDKSTLIEEDYPTLLYYSAANKCESFMDYTEVDDDMPLFSTKITNYLYEELNQKKRKISDVVNEIERKTSSESNDDYNICKIYNKFKKNYEETILQYKEDKESDDYFKKIRQCEISSNLGFTSKIRHISNDRMYSIGNEADLSSYSDLYKLDKIYVVDIRYPKYDFQLDYTDICKSLNVNKTILLSKILDICYEEYGFDNVIIFDFACRVLSENESENESNLSKIYKKYSSDLNEIKKGHDTLSTYSNSNLGGRRLKRNYLTKKNKKNKQNKKSKKSKRKNKKSKKK
jgi:hypothetical protein